MSNLAVKPQASIALVVLNGPDKGATYKILSRTVTIGRATENDIVINNDQRCSRQHARISFTDNGPIVQCLNENNPITVDGKECRQAPLGNNSEIIVGSTRLRFTTHDPSALAQAQPSDSPNVPSRSKKRRKIKLPSTGKSLFRLVAGVVLLVFVYIVISSPGTKNSLVINFDESSTIIKANELELRNREEQRRKTGEDTAQYTEAQSHFLRGFRDYQQGQYERAQTSFQACLSLFPTHKLCRRYLDLSTKIHAQIIQKQMSLGLHYKNQNQFRACLSAFSTAMVMIQDQTNKKYEEAKSNYEYCLRRLEEGLF